MIEATSSSRFTDRALSLRSVMRRPDRERAVRCSGRTAARVVVARPRCGAVVVEWPRPARIWNPPEPSHRATLRPCMTQSCSSPCSPTLRCRRPSSARRPRLPLRIARDGQLPTSSAITAASFVGLKRSFVPASRSPNNSLCQRNTMNVTRGTSTQPTSSWPRCRDPIAIVPAGRLAVHPGACDFGFGAKRSRRPSIAGMRNWLPARRASSAATFPCWE